MTFPARPFPADPRKCVCALLGPSTLGMAALAPISWTPPPPPTLPAPLAAVKTLLSRWHRQRRQPLHDRSEQPPRQMPFRQQQPVIPGVFDQAATRLHQSLLQARQRLGVNSPRHGESAPQIPQIVGDHAQPQSHLVRPEPVTTQSRHLDRLLAFLDPLLPAVARLL